MTDLTIVDVEPSSREMGGVLRLHRGAKARLGFLPDHGFVERARRGTLIAASRGQCVVGYVLFDITGDRVKLRHLCVEKAERGAGVARLLVEELKSRHGDRRNLELACRRDYRLEDMWQALGFRPVHNRPGRSDAGHLLTTWRLDFGHPDLFSVAPIVGDLACLDQMVLEDLATDRLEGVHSKHLLDDWVFEHIELCVTDEASIESNNTSDDELRKALLVAVDSYRNLSRPNAPWRARVSGVAALAPRAGAADHRHLARAIEGGAAYFVTRDPKLLEAAEALEAAFDIVTLRPEGLLDRLDRQRSEERYEPAVLQGTELVEERLSAYDQDAFVTALLNHGEGEPAIDFRTVVRAALADPATSEVRVVRRPGGAILAGVVRRTTADAVVVARIRVRRVDRLTDAIARQVVFQQRQHAAELGLGRVEVDDPSPSPAIVRALSMESFIAESHVWTCRVERGISSADATLDASGTLEAAAYERRRWPVKIANAGLEAFMVSIEPAWAERLFEANLADATLSLATPRWG